MQYSDFAVFKFDWDTGTGTLLAHATSSTPSFFDISCTYLLFLSISARSGNFFCWARVTKPTRRNCLQLALPFALIIWTPRSFCTPGEWIGVVQSFFFEWILMLICEERLDFFCAKWLKWKENRRKRRGKKSWFCLWGKVLSLWTKTDINVSRPRALS